MAYPKMNNMYLPDGFPNTPDVSSASGGKYTAGDGISISGEKEISVAIGDGLTTNADDEVVPDLGDGLTLDESDKIVPDVDGTTIDVNESGKLACLVTGAFDYDTDEFDTGMKWTDGSPVYGKVLQTSTLVAGTNDINHGITGLNHLLTYYGFITTASSGDVPLPVVAAAAANMTGIQAVDATKVVLYIGSNYAGTYAPSSANVVIFYTKTVSP